MGSEADGEVDSGVRTSVGEDQSVLIEQWIDDRRWDVLDVGVAWIPPPVALENATIGGGEPGGVPCFVRILARTMYCFIAWAVLVEAVMALTPKS